MFLKELNQNIRILKGIGSSGIVFFRKLKVVSIADLLLLYPTGYDNRKKREPLSTVLSRRPKNSVNTVVEITSHSYIGYGKNKTLKIHVDDNTSSAVLLCFGRNFMAKKILPGQKYFLRGDFQYKYNELQCSNFELEPYSSNPRNFNIILPVYPLSGKLTQRLVRKVMAQGIRHYGNYIENEMPEQIMEDHNLLKKSTAIKQIHFPDDTDLLQKARKTLIFEEFFHLQLVVGRRSFRRRKHIRPEQKSPAILQNQLIKKLPFSLTKDQKKVISEITKDLKSNYPMARLLQGDVGSGKTLVALLIALTAVELGKQVAFMAPTELLAKQHAENAAKLLSSTHIRLAFISSNIKNRKFLLNELASGNVDLIIGTHALFTKDVDFKSLGLVIVDEQHKFGVLQRIALMKKGSVPDLLLMTATPIPRSLTLTVFGDLEISTIKTMPEGRRPVVTHLTRENNEKKVYDRVRNEINRGKQAYFVYPLIQESDKILLKDAETMHEYLSTKIFPEFSTGLIHSRVPVEKKMEIMGDFSSGKIDILVATSVVEVGVDVKNATCIVIEHAERFGLSSLHQLRGRVGRGRDQSYAFLIYSKDLSEDAKKRLKVMKNFSDGFKIAEKDLEIRGPGDIAGTRQSGFLELSIASIPTDMKILIKARKSAFDILKADPGFLLPENKILLDVFIRIKPFSEKIIEST